MRILRWKVLLLLAIVGALSAHPQAGAPAFRNGDVRYPPIARAAHVSGGVEVRFHLESDGSTSSIQEVSGPIMLSHALATAIGAWKFQTPLPLNADKDWIAQFQYGLKGAQDDDLEDAVDGPPAYPCCGDMITLSAEATQVQGTVRSEGGSQTIEWKPQAITPADSCPNDTNHNVPSKTSAEDFIEIQRRGYYSVTAFRGGRVEWNGIANVDAVGARQSTMDASTSDRLFERVAQQEFWSACGILLPPERDGDDYPVAGQFFTVQLGGQRKTVQLYMVPKLAWAMDTAANTHAWRHGDAAQELPRNMYDDLHEPKPGISALIRSTQHFNPYTGQWTDAALKYQLAHNADVEGEDASGWTALSYAAVLDVCCNQESTIQLLLNAHANPNHASLHGDTPLLLAAYSGDLNPHLLQAGANINVQNADGVSVLMLLAQKATAKELRAAIAAGADATSMDRKGRTAMDYLVEASCDRAIVPLPVPWMQVGLTGPKICPPNTEEYRERAQILNDAMAAQKQSRKR